MVKQKFRKERRNIIASYDRIDVADGTGIVKFLGANTSDSGTVTYLLTRGVINSNDVITQGTAAGTGAETILDLDFDVKFNRPVNIKGKFKVMASWIGGHTTTPGKDGTSQIQVKVRHWDGSTETDLVSNTISDNLVVATSVTAVRSVLIEMDLTTVRHFKAGETLRVTILLKQTAGGSSFHQVALCHDPSDRVPTEYTSALDANPQTTQFIVEVPFKLSI